MKASNTSSTHRAGNRRRVRLSHRDLFAPRSLMDRRTFLAVTAAGSAGRLNASDRLPIKKALYESMLPQDVSYADRFKIARDAGFEQVECGTQTDERKAAEIKRAAESSGLQDPLGDEPGALGISALVGRSGRRRQEHSGHGDQPAQRELLGRRYGAAGTGPGEPRDELSRCVDALAAADPASCSRWPRS